MDDPGLDRARHVHALVALRAINTVSLAGVRVWREVSRLGEALGRPVRVLDLACGGGDVLHHVARRASAAGKDVDLHGCDLSPVALGEAERAAPAGPSMRFFELDVLRDAIPGGYDLVTSSLFLHHLERPDVVSLLRRSAAAAGSGVLFQDLRRTRLGYLFAWIGLHTLTTSEIARHDGLLSVRAAFTAREMRDAAREAGLVGATIHTVWPQRFVLRWMRA
jgi:2-polyprenyl-3-methyl-5-hydroxy-6-metoxy-1,4-benzoquinol methylase